jgi:hypothetical protein
LWSINRKREKKMQIEGFEIDYWYPDDAHEGFQQWPEAGSEDLEEEVE